MIFFGHARITPDLSGLGLEELKALLVQALEEVAGSRQRRLSFARRLRGSRV
jgi:hypothetical protein